MINIYEMGIRGLYSYLHKHYPKCFRRHTTLEHYRGKTVAIDVMIYLYKYKAIYHELHVGWTQLLLTLRAFDIHCVAVYDSDERPNDLKSTTVLNRQRTNKRRRQQISEYRVYLDEYLEHPDQPMHPSLVDLYKRCHRTMIHTGAPDVDKLVHYIEKMERQTRTIQRADVALSKSICHELGVMVLDAPSESDKLCAYLFHCGLVDYIVSDDSDFIAYGCSMLRNVSLLDSYRGLSLIECNIRHVMSEMGMDYEQLLLMCIGFGTDYNHPVSVVREYFTDFNDECAMMANVVWLQRPIHVGDTLRSIGLNEADVSAINYYWASVAF